MRKTDDSIKHTVWAVRAKSSGGVRTAIGLTVMALATAACGSAPATPKASSPAVTASAPDLMCIPFVCDPTRDYGQPTLASLRDAQSRITPGAAADLAAGGTGTLTGTGTGTGTGGSIGSPGSTGGGSAPAGPAGVAGATGPAGRSGAAGATGSPGASSGNFANAYKQVKPSVALLFVQDCSTGDDFLGTGFAVSPNLVVTAGHMIDGMHHNVTVYIGGKKLVAQPIGLDASRDVGLLRLSQPVAVPALHLATGWPEIGSPVAAIGFAQGLGLSMQQGIVSATNVAIDATNYGFLQTDITADHGSSGGPVVDQKSNVVGIVSGSVGLVDVEAGSPGAATLIAGWRAHPQHVASTC